MFQEKSPICGSDGNTYINECELKLYSCKSKEPISVSYRGDCGMLLELNYLCDDKIFRYLKWMNSRWRVDTFFVQFSQWVLFRIVLSFECLLLIIHSFVYSLNYALVFVYFFILRLETPLCKQTHIIYFLPCQISAKVSNVRTVPDVKMECAYVQLIVTKICLCQLLTNQFVLPTWTPTATNVKCRNLLVNIPWTHWLFYFMETVKNAMLCEVSALTDT